MRSTKFKLFRYIWHWLETLLALCKYIRNYKLIYFIDVEQDFDKYK